MTLRRTTAFIAFAMAAIAVAAPSAQSADFNLDDYPSLKPAIEEMRSELQLTDSQFLTAKGLIGEQLDRVSGVVDDLDKFNFDTAVDLLIEARSVRDDFIPELRGILDAEQKEKLRQLPRSHDLYVSAMAGWLTEGRVEKLSSRLGLEPGQIPGVREALFGQFDESIRIVSGLVDFEGDPMDLIMDSLVDLRLTQREANRAIERQLDDAQKAKFEKLID